jgi:hypothetical protein
MLHGCEESNPQTEDCRLETNNDPDPNSHKVLFIGNSHTYTCNIPLTIEKMAIEKGDTIKTSKETPGGYSLKQHSMRKQTINAIKSVKWDFVILQGSGGWNALPPFMADTAINRYAQILADTIRKNSTHTKIILYMTHGYREGVLSFNDYEWCEEDPLVCTYEGMQERLRENYLILAEILNSEIAPSGMMWKILMDKYPEINLYHSDGIHANSSGSYIAACTIFSLIFKKSPENTYIPENVNEDIAQKIQNAVLNALFDCNPNWISYPIK